MNSIMSIEMAAQPSANAKFLGIYKTSSKGSLHTLITSSAQMNMPYMFSWLHG